MLRFLADMNISPRTVTALKNEGWDIIRVSEVLPSNTSDADLLNYARKENRTIITQDLDFSALVALSGLDKPSLVILRLMTADPESITAKLISIIPQYQDLLLQGFTITIEDTSVRLHKLPIE